MSANELLDELLAASAERDRAVGMLWAGDVGVGKTTLFKTVPKPALIFSFDPSGTAVLSEEIAKGEVVVDTRYEKDNPKAPTAFYEFTKNWNQMLKAGVFDMFNTVGIDSYTGMQEACLMNYMRLAGELDSTASQRTYGIVQMALAKMITSLYSFPRLAVCTFHIEEKILAEGRVKTVLAVIGAAAQRIYRKTSEIYHVKRRDEKGGKRTLITQTIPTEEVACRTRFAKCDDFIYNMNVEQLLKDNGYVYPELPMLTKKGALK